MIHLLDESSSLVRQAYEIARVEGAECFLSSIVLFELQTGVFKSVRTSENQRRLNELVSSLEPLPFLHTDASEAARIRAELERQKQPIGPMDTLIAGHAIARNLILITANTREFSRIPQLQWQDWTTHQPSAPTP